MEAANCSPQVASAVEPITPDAEGLATAVLDRIGQFVCAIHGHDQVVQFAEGRMYLRCVSCGHESPGWQMPERTPVLKFKGFVQPEADVRPARRVA